MIKIFLFCGLPGSGKTTFAKKILNNNLKRYSLDKEVFSIFGRESDINYKEREKKAKEIILSRTLEDLKTGKSVILDFGFWKEKDRDFYKKFFQNNGYSTTVVYFK